MDGQSDRTIRCCQPIPRTAPSGSYLNDLLWAQYNDWLGESIHGNDWRSD